MTMDDYNRMQAGALIARAELLLRLMELQMQAALGKLTGYQR